MATQRLKQGEVTSRDISRRWNEEYKRVGVFGDAREAGAWSKVAWESISMVSFSCLPKRLLWSNSACSCYLCCACTILMTIIPSYILPSRGKQWTEGQINTLYPFYPAVLHPSVQPPYFTLANVLLLWKPSPCRLLSVCHSIVLGGDALLCLGVPVCGWYDSKAYLAILGRDVWYHWFYKNPIPSITKVGFVIPVRILILGAGNKQVNFMGLGKVGGVAGPLEFFPFLHLYLHSWWYFMSCSL